MQTDYQPLFEAARQAGAALPDIPAERLSEAVRTAAEALRRHL